MLSFNQQKQMIILGLFAAVALIALLFISTKKPDPSNGTWICRSGEWIAEGKPDSEMPDDPCY
jgi:hypothetical protein